VVVLVVVFAACRAARPPAPPDVQGSVAGIYRAYLPAADAAGRAITLELRASGGAQLTTLYAGNGEPLAESGTWSADASGIRVQLAARNGGAVPAPIAWTQRRLRLEPSEWDEQVYGALGLPLVRWTPSRDPKRGCTWRPLTDAGLGLRLLAESCARSATPFDVGTAIESFPKRADASIEVALTERFVAPLPGFESTICAVRRAKGVALDDPTKFAFEIAPKRKRAPLEPACQTWGAQHGWYFEYHPAESRERVLFVRRGAGTPGFDERSIELLW
jgi:hypothetical protein